MIKWLRAILPPKKGVPHTDQSLLELERNIRSLELELAERDKTILTLKEDVHRLRENQTVRLEAEKSAQLERIFTDLAPQVIQLVTQAHLVEVQSKTLANADILAVTQRLLKTLQKHGLAIESHTGEQIAFDPSRHMSLEQTAALKPGQVVIVRFVGISYRGMILRKAGVETAKSHDDSAEQP